MKYIYMPVGCKMMVNLFDIKAWSNDSRLLWQMGHGWGTKIKLNRIQFRVMSIFLPLSYRNDLEL